MQIVEAKGLGDMSPETKKVFDELKAQLEEIVKECENMPPCPEPAPKPCPKPAPKPAPEPSPEPEPWWKPFLRSCILIS
jgi:hypothetical protein